MKKLYAILAAACAIAACAKDNNPSGSAEKTDVTFQIVTPTTKALDVNVENEKNVNSVQIFVFNKADGSIDAMSQRETGSTVTLACGVGEKVVAAVVNGPEVAQSTTYTQARLARVISSFADNNLDAFVMVGTDTTVLSARATVPVRVKRLVCKVVLKEIVRDFDQNNYASYNDTPLNITGVFLKNVAGQCSYGSNYTINTWYNKSVTSTSDPDQNKHYTDLANVQAMIAEYDIADVALNNGESHSVTHSFYAYPNPEKSTLLTVETTLGDKTLYYPLSLPALESNKVYTLTKLTLSRPGGDYDDKDTIIFQVDVEDWEEGDTWEENY